MIAPAAERTLHVSKSLDMLINDYGDTAEITTILPKVAVDSFAYIDSFSYQADTSAHATITWTSPVQKMVVTFAGLTATPTLGDTAITYSISANFAADTLDVTFDPSDNIDTNDLATIIDSVVATFNGTAALSDSIVAQDSGTYILLRSLIDQVTLTKRWSIAAGDSLDTSSTGRITTKGMICDSMVAAINANTGLDSFLTAAVVAGTTFTVTADDKGVLFWDSTLNDPDTFGTVTRTQANVTSRSRTIDTILAYSNYSQGGHASGYYGTVILAVAPDTVQGIGASDSAVIYLYGGRYSHDGSTIELRHKLDSVKAGAVPCTLFVAKLPNVAGADTLFDENIFIYYDISDTASDTIMRTAYPLYIDLQALEN